MRSATQLRLSTCAPPLQWRTVLPFLAPAKRGRLQGLAVHRKHHAKARLAAEHAVVALGGLFERDDFIHRMDSGPGAKLQRVLRVNRGAGVPALDRTTSAEQ